MKHYFWFIVTVILVLILSLAKITIETPLDDVPLIDKWVHFVMYGAVVCSAWISKDRYSWNFMFAVLIFSVVLGGVIEILQSMTDYRSGDWLDFIADAIGAVLGSVISGILVASGLVSKLPKWLRYPCGYSGNR